MQAAIVRPFLTDHAKALVAKLDPSKSSYKDVKEALLREYKISAPMYRDKFNELVKKDDQTYVMYVSSLLSLIDGYVEACKVTTLDELRNLLVADRLKVALKPDILKYVLSVEAKSDRGWIDPYELADLVDDYVANYHDSVSPRSGALTGKNSKFKAPFMSKPQANSQVSPVVQDSGQNSSPAPITTQTGEVKKPQLMCWHCGGPHLVRFCPKTKNSASRATGKAGRANKAAVNEVSGDSPAVEQYPKSADNTRSMSTVEQGASVESCACVNNSVNRTAVDCVDSPTRVMIDDDCVIIESVKHPLSYMDVVVTLLQTPADCVRAKALKDSGSECALKKQSVLQCVGQIDPIDPIGEVKISGICGDPVICPLVRIKLYPTWVEDRLVD